MLGERAPKRVSHLLVLLVVEELLLDLVVHVHLVVHVLLVSGSAPVLLNWRRHQLLEVLALIDLIEDATAVFQVVNVEPNIADDSDAGEQAEEHHQPEVALLFLGAEEHAADDRADRKANVLHGRAEAIGSADEAGRHRVGDAAPEGRSVHRVAKAKQAQRQQAQVVGAVAWLCLRDQSRDDASDQDQDRRSADCVKSKR